MLLCDDHQATTLVEASVCGKNEQSMLQCQHSQQRYNIFQNFRVLLSFKRHFSYKSVNGSCWIQVAGSCGSRLLAVASPRKVSSIVTSSKWWSRLNEIKEAYRMELHFQYHSADRHSIAKLSASWDLFACSSSKIACWGPVTCRLKFVYISRKSGILKFCMGCFLLRSQLHEPRLPKESSISENTWPSGSRGLVFELVVWAHPHVNPCQDPKRKQQ